MKEKALLKHILDRVAQLDGMSNTFTSDELAYWPKGALDSLEAQGLLIKTEPAKIVECQGCEEYCLMPVHVVSNETIGRSKAFIVCDKRDDVGRVSVELARLRQWKLTGHTLALKLIEMLGFELDPMEKQRGKAWELGILKGKVNRPHLVLNIENGASLIVGPQEVPLLDVLDFKKGKLFLDVDELMRMADQSPRKFPKYSPSVLKRESRKLTTSERHKSWQKKYRSLKASKPGMTDAWYAQQIARHFGNKHSSETIRKNMKP